MSKSDNPPPSSSEGWTWFESDGVFESGARNAHRRALLNGVVLAVPTGLVLVALLNHSDHLNLGVSALIGGLVGVFVVGALYGASRFSDGAGRRVGIAEVRRAGLGKGGVRFVSSGETLEASWTDLKPVRVGSFRGAPFLAVVIAEGPERTVEGPRMVALPGPLALALLDFPDSPGWGITPEEREKLVRGGEPARAITTPT